MKEIPVYDSSGNRLSALVQWDSDVYIYLRDSGLTQAYYVHFFNQSSDMAYVVQSQYQNGVLSVKIPNILLRQARNITGYVNVTDSGEGRCLYGFQIRILPKPKPSDTAYEDTVDYISLQDVLKECRDYASSAGNSATSAQSSKNAAQTAAASAQSAKESAQASQMAAAASESAAEQSKTAAKTSETHAAASAAAAKSYSSGAGIVEIDITVPVSAWTQRQADDGPDSVYRVAANVYDTNILAKHIPVITLGTASFDAARKAELFPCASTFDGGLKLWAVKAPSQSVIAHVVLLSNNNT